MQIETQFLGRNGGINMKTLRDFWNTADGVYDFVDKNGVSIDDMDYPLETEVLNERLIEGEQYEVMLNVEV